MGADILRRREGSDGNVDGSRGDHALGQSAQRLHKKLRDPKTRGGLTDARKVHGVYPYRRLIALHGVQVASGIKCRTCKTNEAHTVCFFSR